MAKRKRKKQTKTKFKYTVELYGIIFFIIAILGLGKLGPVGQLISSFSLFLVGSLYMVLLAVLLIIGIYIFIKREWPDFFSTKLIGIYLFVLGGLIAMHWGFLKDNTNMMNVFKSTIDQLLNGFNLIMNKQVIDLLPTVNNNATIAFGGGIIGGVFGILFTMLCSYKGMQIISVAFLIIGFLLFTGFSIVDFVRDSMENAKNNRLSKKEEKLQNKEEKLDNKHVIISNGNEDEEDDEKSVDDKHIKISSISDLNKVPEKVEENDTETEEEPKEKVSINHSYQLPPLSLLNKPKKKDNSTDGSAIEANIEKLEKVLASFNVTAKVVEVHIGPTVAQYELEIAAGTRVNKITTLSREIALALSKKDVRIEAPIPGKNTVGIEFANDNPMSVSFYEIMASKVMAQATDKKLMVPLGKSIMGDIGVCEINKMPHMLIAGTTGSGKSVCVNGIICSILMRAKPDEVKLAMVDPKVVELSVYNGIPHLMCPVVSDPKKAAILLAKMVAEMEKRYQMFSDSGTKKIEGYNEYVDKWNKQHPDAQKAKMPFIVVIIDELADLMMVAAKEVEDSILRITQKARAAGIHLIVATQRPSTEVITGLIKANIPSRISFAVGSGIDSRTILDQVGAEKLLGKGDMFFLPIGQNSPTRVQGSFITDEEIQKIIDFTVEQQKAQYDDSFMKLDANDNPNSNLNGTMLENGVDNSDDEDPLYQDIVEFVIETQKASASLIQRKFKLGYNRAARIVDLLEERGIIGPPNGSKPREVLVSLDDSASDNSEE